MKRRTKDDLIVENESLRQQLESAELYAKKLDAENAEAASDYEELEEELARIEAELPYLRKLKEFNDTQARTIRKQRDVIDELRREVNTRIAERNDAVALNDDLVKHAGDLRSKDDVINRLQRDLDSADNAAVGDAAEIRALRDKVTELETEVEQHERIAKKHENDWRQVNYLTDALERSTESSKADRNTIKELIDSRQEKQARIRELDAALEQKTSEYDELRAMYDALQTDDDLLENEYEALYAAAQNIVKGIAQLGKLVE